MGPLEVQQVFSGVVVVVTEVDVWKDSDVVSDVVVVEVMGGILQVLKGAEGLAEVQVYPD